MKIIFPNIAEGIKLWVALDQRMRRRNLKDPEYWDKKVDKQNTAHLQATIRQIGWPTRSKVGKAASHGAWLIAQHAYHDHGFQLECLLLMKAEKPPEVELRDIAYLEDRLSCNTYGYQMYGTQFTQENGEHVPRPIKYPSRVDSRRKSMGLGTLRQGIADMNSKYPFAKKPRKFQKR